MIPQVILSLTQSGQLALEIPGPQGIRHKIELGSDPLETIMRVLRDQQARPEPRVAIGLDGAPTQAQVTHWERHAIWRDPSCPFCASELAGALREDKKAKARRVKTIRLGDGVEVRKIPAKQRHEVGTRATNQSMEELGL